ncbi:MAG: hypothetical protein AAGI03_16430, partial [Pseudomonadota bacterium]
MSDVADFSKHFRDRHGRDPVDALHADSEKATSTLVLTHDDLTTDEAMDDIMLSMAYVGTVCGDADTNFDSAFEDAAKGLGE